MTEDNYKFIEEKIMPQRKRVIKERIFKLARLAVSGAVFGGAAVITGILIYNSGIIHSDSNTQAEVTPALTQTPAITNITDGKDEQAGKDERTGKEEQDGKNEQAGKEDKRQSIDLENFTIADYAEVREMVADFAESYDDTIVTVAKVTEGVDCFKNPVESSDSFSGVVVRVDEQFIYILTEYDGIVDNSAYEIYFRNGEYTRANVLGVDKITGLAVISARIDELSLAVLESARKAVFGDSTQLRVGEFVTAIGNPAGSMYSMSYGTVLTKPIVKYITDRCVSLFHTDMPCVANGGGVVMNYEGKIVGFITKRFDTEESNITSFIGASELENLISFLISNRNMLYMGIVPSDMSDEYMLDNNLTNGIYVTSVEHGSPAENANLATGDIIVSIGNEEVEDVYGYSNIIASYNAGDEIAVTIRRPYAKKDVERTVNIVLGEAVR